MKITTGLSFAHIQLLKSFRPIHSELLSSPLSKTSKLFIAIPAIFEDVRNEYLVYPAATTTAKIKASFKIIFSYSFFLIIYKVICRYLFSRWLISLHEGYIEPDSNLLKHAAYPLSMPVHLPVPERRQQ